LLVAVLEESRTRDDVILFADELASTAESAGQAGIAMSVMAPMLASGQLQLIGGATTKEYSRSWQDGALAPQIQPVQVSDPSNSYGIGMLKIALRSAAQTKVLEDY
jgi:ATP-dependent Clp protease ATP-binding subunit ClpA